VDFLPRNKKWRILRRKNPRFNRQYAGRVNVTNEHPHITAVFNYRYFQYRNTMPFVDYLVSVVAQLIELADQFAKPIT
jgi:hypothetical protein